MFARMLTAGAFAILGVASAVMPSSATAQGWGAPDRGYSLVQHRRDRGDRRWRDDRRDYGGDRRAYRRRCRDRGSGGTIIGAIAGGLLGDAVVGRRGDGTAGALVGAGVGALAGRAIDRSDGRPC